MRKNIYYTRYVCVMRATLPPPLPTTAYSAVWCAMGAAGGAGWQPVRVPCGDRAGRAARRRGTWAALATHVQHREGTSHWSLPNISCILQRTGTHQINICTYRAARSSTRRLTHPQGSTQALIGRGHISRVALILTLRGRLYAWLRAVALCCEAGHDLGHVLRDELAQLPWIKIIDGMINER